MNDKKEQLEKSIDFIKHRLKSFSDEDLLTEEGSQVYNQLLIKKAVLAKDLEKFDENKFHNFANRIKRKILGKKLICDNF